MNFFKPNEEENNHRVDDDEYEEELDFEADDDIPREEDEDFQSDDDYNPVKVAFKIYILRNLCEFSGKWQTKTKIRQSCQEIEIVENVKVIEIFKTIEKEVEK